MTIRNVLAGIAVRDLGSATRWYERLFRRSPDSRPMPGLAEWHFERGGWVQVFEDRDRAGYCSATLAVSDLGEQLRAMKQAGIETGELSVSEQTKTAVLEDPDGNRLVLAEALSDEIAC